MSLPAVATALYALPPEEFTAARNAQVAAAKQAGDDALAASIKQLRRPSASAAVLNGLVRERAEQVAELMAVGGQLRTAQDAGAGDDLRALMRTRQDLLRELVSGAEHHASKLGIRFTTAVQREVQATLMAAVADPAAEQALRSGTLVSGLNYAGFGDVAQSAASPRTGRAARDRTAAQRREEARERLATARSIATERRDELRAVESELTQLDEQLAENARELQRLQQRRDRAGDRLAKAQHAHDEAVRQVEQAQHALP